MICQGFFKKNFNFHLFIILQRLLQAKMGQKKRSSEAKLRLMSYIFEFFSENLCQLFISVRFIGKNIVIAEIETE